MRNQIWIYITPNYNDNFVKVSFLVKGHGTFCVLVAKATKKMTCQMYAHDKYARDIIEGTKHTQTESIRAMANCISNGVFDKETHNALIIASLHFFKAANQFSLWPDSKMTTQEYEALTQHIHKINDLFNKAIMKEYDFTCKDYGVGECFLDMGEHENDGELSSAAMMNDNAKMCEDGTMRGEGGTIMVRSDVNKIAAKDFGDIIRQIRDIGTAYVNGKQYVIMDNQLYERFDTTAGCTGRGRWEGGKSTTRHSRKMAKLVDAQGMKELVSGNYYDVVGSENLLGKSYLLLETDYGVRKVNADRILLMDVYDEPPTEAVGEGE